LGDWQVGVFRIDIEAGVLIHKSSGAKIKPAVVDFSLHSNSWTLEYNYNEKAARLKNCTIGVSFSAMFLFKTAGNSAPKPIKVAILSLEEAATPADDTTPRTSHLQDLKEGVSPSPSADSRTTMPRGTTAFQEDTAQPVFPTFQPLEFGIESWPTCAVSRGTTGLEAGSDSRARPAQAPQKRLGTSTGSLVPAPVRRRLARKMSEEEARAPEVSEAEPSPTSPPAASQTPSTVPTEEAVEEENQINCARNC